MPTQSKSETAPHFTTRHSVVLAVENPMQFQRLLDDHIAIHQPANPAELDLVEEMVTARWRIRRMWAVETSLIDKEMKRRGGIDEDQFECMAEAFRTLADDSRALALASR